MDVRTSLRTHLLGHQIDDVKLLEGSEIEAICRRLTVIAYEDIGLANPGIGPRLDAAINAAERVGLPEARIPIAEIAIEMALSPKSNSAYLALDLALNDIHKGLSTSIPKHIKNGSSDYKYPHNYPNSWVNQEYLPEKLSNAKYYIPKNNSIENNLNKVHIMMKGGK